MYIKHSDLFPKIKAKSIKKTPYITIQYKYEGHLEIF